MIPSAAPTRIGAAERAAITDAVARVITDGPWILGPVVEQFERVFGTYLGGLNVVGVGNGTDALAIAFATLDLPPGAGVLVAANEGGYAATALRLAGLAPVVMDVDDVTMLPSVETAEAAMRTDVAAVVITHLHGEATDIRPLDAWRTQRGLRMVEDCAQAHGARRDGIHVGRLGDAATFSFYPTKNLGAIGDGGAVLFADDAHAARARALREYGWNTRFRIEVAGGRNSRLDPLQAAVLIARLPFLDARNKRRRAISARYRDALATSGARMHGDAETTVAHHAVVLTDARDEMATFLADRDIQTAIHYPYLLGEMPGLRLGPGVPVPAAAGLRDRILSLPCYPELSDDEVGRVVTALEGWTDG